MKRTGIVLLSVLFVVSMSTMSFAAELVKLWDFQLEEADFWVFDPSPAIGDLTGDANLEVVFGTGEYNASWGRGGRYVALDAYGNFLWNGLTPDDWTGASPAIADLDGDSQQEVIGGSCSGQWLLSYDGSTGLVEWQFGGSGYRDDGTRYRYGEFKPSPAIVDVLAAYPGPEIFTADQGGNVIVLSSSGQLIWEHEFAEYFTSSTPVADIDADGKLEMIAIAEDGKVFCFDAATGTIEWTYDVPEEWDYFYHGYYNYYYNEFRETRYGATVISSPAVANLDGDPALELVFGSVGGSLYCLDGLTGTVEWTFPTGGPVASSPAIGDVDNDAALEIVVGSQDRNVYCLNTAGELEWSYAAGGKVNGSPALVNRDNLTVHAVEWPMFLHDLNRTSFYGSGKNNLSIYIGADDGYLYLLSGKRGKLKARFQATDAINASPAVGDIDGDGMQEVLFKDVGYFLYGLRDNNL